MKIFHLLPSAFILLSFASCSRSRSPGHTTKLGREETFMEFKGLEIRNRQNEKLGNILFLTVDLENARLVEVVVEAARPGRGITSVAPRTLTLESEQNLMWIDMSRERFDAAPRVNPADVTGDYQRDRIAALNRYSGLEPWFYVQGQTQHSDAKTLRLGHVRRSEQVVNLPLVNKRGTSLGRLTTLRTDISKGQIIHVVVDRGGFTENLSVTQARALTYNAQRNGLVLDDTQAQLAGEPGFLWTGSSHTAYQEQKNKNRAGTEDGKTMTASGMEQGDDYRDTQKTSRIRSGIHSAFGLSSRGRAVQVATLNAQTTLRGQVSTEAEKAQIGQIAMRSGRLENVSNLIEVRLTKR
jgi:sporulation protein YlmC with PRC-barrel domain